MPKANGRADDLPALASTPVDATTSPVTPAEPRRLTRSRSIPSGEHNVGITPLFPGPLLPTVRRLNSSPKVIFRTQAGLQRANADDADATVGNERALEQRNGRSCADKGLDAASSSHSAEAASAGGPAGGLAAELREFSKANDERLRITFDKFDKAKVAKDTTPSSLLSYDGGLLHKSGMRSWGPRPRADGDGDEHLPLRPAKALRTEVQAAGSRAAEKFQPQEVHGRSSPSARPEASGQQLQFNQQQQRLQSDKLSGPNFSSRGIRGPGSLTPLDTEVDAYQQDTGSSGLRNRKPQTGLGLLDLSEEAFEGRQVLESYVNEVGRQQGSSGGSKRSPGSPVTAQHQPSYIRKLLSVPLCSKTSLLLMLTVCVVAMLYAFAMHTEVQMLRDELQNLRRTSKSCACVTTGHSSELAVAEDEIENKAIGARRFALSISFLFLLTPFMFFKYVDDFPKLTGMASTGTEEELPLSKQVAYRVDVLFSTHSFAKPVALLLATMLLIGVGGVALFGVSTESLSDTLWLAWSYVADSGNHADSIGFGPRVVSVSISFGGMLIFALMLGLVSDAISEKVDSLRKGKSEVIESNHTLILGWSDKLGSLLKQLAIANQSLGGGIVVVLAERDKEEMESDIAKLEFDFMGTKVICRSGSPLIMADLKKVSVSKARALIVLAEVENADQSDARALRVVLNLTGVKEGLRGHVVVELSDVDNEQLVKLVGGELVETVVAHDVIGRLMIQCARQPGLAQIWENILGFANAEFYVKRWPQLDGMKFEDVLISFPDAVPCGVKVAARDGQIVLNPDDDYVLSEGDELLVLAEDDDTYAPGSLPEVRRVALPEIVSGPKLAEKILFCGWRRDMDDMIMVLEAFVASGSELWLFSDIPLGEREKRLQDGGLYCDQLENTKLVHREGNAVIRRHLESLPLETFDSILILADEALEETVVNADSRSLATLLLIRDIQSKRMPYRDKGTVVRGHSGATQSSWINEMQQASDNSIIISEILDSRTKNLVSVSKISDYVLSNELVSMALAMVAEDKQINRVLEELFAEEGNELYIRTAEAYLYDQEELSFYEVMIRARQRQEIVIGYRRATSEKAIINPPDKGNPVKWSVSDVFIVLAEEE